MLSERDLWDIVHEVIDDYIEDRILFDIILEIINTNKAYRDYSLYTPEHRMIAMLAD